MDNPEPRLIIITPLIAEWIRKRKFSSKGLDYFEGENQNIIDLGIDNKGTYQVNVMKKVKGQFVEVKKYSKEFNNKQDAWVYFWDTIKRN
jgi:hypothetical protein